MKPKQPKPKCGDMVEIIWTDAHTPRNMDWMDNDTYNGWAKDGITIRSVGIIMKIDEKYYYLVSNKDVSPKASERTVCGAINIPIDSTKEIYVLKRVK
jgi:hypothetical protein